MTLTINGTDFVPFLAQQGLEQTWKTRESKNSGLVTADGTEHVAILSQKRQLKVSAMFSAMAVPLFALCRSGTP